MRTLLERFERALVTRAHLRGHPRRGALLFCWGLLMLVPAASHGSTLSGIASALQPGHYAVVNTGLTGDDFYPDPSDKAGSIIDWADSGDWDPVRHRFYYVGKKAGCSSPYRNLVYDEAANSWSYGPVPLSSGCGHGYDQNTGDPVTGTNYFRPYNSVIYKYNGSSWVTLPALPTSAVVDGAIAKSRSGLLYSDYVWDIYYNASEQPTAIDVQATYPSFPLMDTANMAEYDPVHDVFLIGGCNTTMFKVTIVGGSPVRSRLNNAPFEIGVNEGNGDGAPHTNITADPVTGEFIVYRKFTGNFYAYNIVTDTWRQIGRSGDGNMPPLPMGSGADPAIAAPINSYGVIMYVAHTGSTAAVYLYKHGSSGPLDTIPPAPPTQLIAR